MTSDQPVGGDSESVATARELLAHATARVLGDTIALSDQDWAAASRLPGWSRGHLGTHLARNADGLCRLATWALTGERQSMYASDEARDAEIEQGAHRAGLAIQEDLDTSAGRLADSFTRLDEAGGEDPWAREVEMRGGRRTPVREVVTARLLEVVVHHVDFGIGFEVADIDDRTALLLLGRVARRAQGRSDYPSLVLRPDGGEDIPLGPAPAPDAEPATVTGPAAALLGWLTQRGGTDALHGADDVDLPSYG